MASPCPHASTTSGDGEALEILLAKASDKLLDLEVVLTQKAHRARLVAFRSSPEVPSRRRQQKKDKRKRNGTQASKRSLVREDWTILVTNITPEQCSAEELFRLYRQRWEIEIHFRAWKQFCRGSNSCKCTRRSIGLPAAFTFMP